LLWLTRIGRDEIFEISIIFGLIFAFKPVLGSV